MTGQLTAPCTIVIIYWWIATSIIVNLNIQTIQFSRKHHLNREISTRRYVWISSFLCNSEYSRSYNSAKTQNAHGRNCAEIVRSVPSKKKHCYMSNQDKYFRKMIPNLNPVGFLSSASLESWFYPCGSYLYNQTTQTSLYWGEMFCVSCAVLEYLKLTDWIWCNPTPENSWIGLDQFFPEVHSDFQLVNIPWA